MAPQIDEAKIATATLQQLTNLNSNITAMIRNTEKSKFPEKEKKETLTTAEGTSVFSRKEDHANEYYKSTTKSFKELIGAVKEINLTKQAGGLAKLLAGAGLLYYLLTGKTEGLDAMVKAFDTGFVKPIAEGLEKATKSLVDNVWNFVKGSGKLAEDAAKAGAKTAEKVAEKAANDAKKGFNIFKATKNLFSKSAREAAKLAKDTAHLATQRGEMLAFAKKMVAEGKQVEFRAAGKLSKAAHATQLVIKDELQGSRGMSSVEGFSGKATKEGKALSKIIKSNPLIKAAELMTGETKDLLKSAGKVAEDASKGAAKEASKVGAKGFLKGGVKSLKALKAIPILGTILGPILAVYFAHDRWKKGDKIGAIGEIASGVISMIPGIGNYISLALDGLLLVRDVIGKDEKTGEFKTDKAMGFGKSMKAVAGAELEVIFKPFKSIIRAYNNFKSGHVLGGLKDLAKAGWEGTVGGIIGFITGVNGALNNGEAGAETSNEAPEGGAPSGVPSTSVPPQKSGQESWRKAISTSAKMIMKNGKPLYTAPAYESEENINLAASGASILMFPKKEEELEKASKHARPGLLAKIEAHESANGRDIHHVLTSTGDVAQGPMAIMKSNLDKGDIDPVFKNIDPMNPLQAGKTTLALFDRNYEEIDAYQKLAKLNLSNDQIYKLAIGAHQAGVANVITYLKTGKAAADVNEPFTKYQEEVLAEKPRLLPSQLKSYKEAGGMAEISNPPAIPEGQMKENMNKINIPIIPLVSKQQSPILDSLNQINKSISSMKMTSNVTTAVKAHG